MHAKLENFSLYLAPLVPSGFNISREIPNVMASFFTLIWNPPQGKGPEAVVDHYTISISPTSSFQSTILTVTVLERNLILEHNVMFSITLTATNCAGESDPSILHIHIGK